MDQGRDGPLIKIVTGVIEREESFRNILGVEWTGSGDMLYVDLCWR